MAVAPDKLERILKDVHVPLEKKICEEIIKVLNSDKDVKSKSIQRLLEICYKDPKDDEGYATVILNIVSIVLRKAAAGSIISNPELLPSMVNLLFMLNSSIYSSTSDSIKIMFFKTLISYPSEVFQDLEGDDKVIDVFNLYFHQAIPIELRVQPIHLLHKYLKALTPQKRVKFVEKGINIWLLKLIPSIMSFVTIRDFDIETPLETLELVVDELRHIDYYDNPNFQSILQCFYEPQKYPKIMKSLLVDDCNIWHRLWIVFIKILKNHLTKTGRSGSPINSMLPVVEAAFKLDTKSRCRAFLCWQALIDNFASETNETYVNKRIKLLIIPLYSNNAKVEDTVIAKINTWWHLIGSYYSKLSNFAEIILIPFLQFCFGKRNDSVRLVPTPGMISEKTKEYCVEALASIFGHHNCNGCVSLPVTKDRILNQKCLSVSGSDLIFSLNSALKIVMDNPSKLWKPYKCAWLSFINSFCDTTDEKLQSNLLNEILDMLLNVVQNMQDDIFLESVLKDLIFGLLKGHEKMAHLLNVTKVQERPMQKLMFMLLNSKFDPLFSRNDVSKDISNFKPFTEFIVQNCDHFFPINAILNRPLSNYKSLVLWSATASTICEKTVSCNEEIMSGLLLWPLKDLDLLCEIEFCTSLWFTLFEFVHPKLGVSRANEEIIQILTNSKTSKTQTILFLLNVSIDLLKKRLTEEGIKCEKEVWLIYSVSVNFNSLDHTNPVFSKLVDVLVEVLKKLSKDINVEIAKHVLMTLKFVFTILKSGFQISTEIDSVLLVKIEQLLKSIQDLLKLEAYTLLNQLMATQFLDYAECFLQQKSLKDTVITTLETALKGLDNNDPSVKTIKKIIDSMSEDSKPTIPIDEKSKFPTPVRKTGNKKDASIVNKVVEDGEEFVVVKSNWKFNPKKLTENQKEKLQRKREDIPALYQDLSQSQDEFRLNTWRTDSQDATTTSASSKSNDLTTSEKVSSILKNVPNTNVVPKILNNILTENNEKINSSLDLSTEHQNENKTPSNKKVKPRLSLKDRVFRSVKMLTDKADGKNDEKQLKTAINDVTIQLATPVGMNIKVSDVNSTPSEVNVERPSRMKRPPKKFEEMEIFGVKKKRNSQSYNDSQNSDSYDDLNSQDVIENLKITATKAGTDISKDQESNGNIVAPSSVENIIKNNDTQDKNNLNVEQDHMAQDENIDKQEPSSEPNVIPDTSKIDIENVVPTENSLLSVTDKSQTNNDQADPKEQNSISNLSNKKPRKKKSRIEAQLAIDMVEGHPFLKAQSEKRPTRNKSLESPVISRRKTLTQKLDKAKADKKNKPMTDVETQQEISSQSDKQIELDNLPDSQQSIHKDEGSQDIIESSQDSTVSIMSVKSSKTAKRVPIVTLEAINQRLFEETKQSDKSINADITIVKESENCNTKVNDSVNCINDDSEFPINRTAEEHVHIDLTEDFDTEPIGKISIDEDVINIEESPTNNNLENTYMETDTQDIAEADTQPLDSKSITNMELENVTSSDDTKTLNASKLQKLALDSVANIDTSPIRTQDEITRSLTESLLCATETKRDESLSKLSPKAEEKRKQDFLNNTSEISPIKALSPVREKKSPTPEKSSDYVVIRLSSPVQSNGEPFEKCDSPEMFTEEKVSPDKRDQSPPRVDTRLKTVSPKSLSLKRNKPKVRTGGRAAQMLGLCISDPDRVQIINSEKNVEAEEPKKSSPKSAAKRNLRILYNSTNETSETSLESEETNNFLKMDRSLPAADSSPSVPILKRKLIDIVDDSTVSPANKRKRVSFHDPPVSTTVCVNKYIDSGSVRSPQNSITKRQERQIRRTKLEVGGNLKSQRRLDTVFKLDTALTKAVESFSDGVASIATEDTEMSSLEPTPLVEVVKNSDLDDIEPICLELIDCRDPVDNIAGDLSSPSMRPLLVKEFAGKIETVGDLAKLTELEVNRLCIRAPKVQVAKKVLTEYAKKVKTIANEITPMTEAAFSESTVVETKSVDVEMQTDVVVVGSIEVQTEVLDTAMANTQTDTVSTIDCHAQTDESGNKSTEDIVKSLLDREDFSDHLNKQLDQSSKQSIAASLPVTVLTDTLLQTMENTTHSTQQIIDNLLEKHTAKSDRQNDERLSFMRNYLSERFNSKDLILLCSDLLRKVHDSSM